MSLKSNYGTFIDRSINELRTGRPIVIKENKNYWMFFNIEHSENKILNQFNKYLLKEKYLLITKQKAQSVFNNKITSNIFLKIEDDGPGIPIKMRNDVLGRGLRLDTQLSGQGIGLAVAKELVGLYEGSLAISDSEMGGAKISLNFPLSRSIN